MKKRILSILLVFLLGITLCSCVDDDSGGETLSDVTSDNVPDTAPSVPDNGAPPSPDMPVSASGESVSVVVLGDSIARGYGLKEVEKSRFSAVLGDKLKSDYKNVTVSNHGVDGMTGAELVAFLSMNAPSELESCDYVLISIGGNNVLGSLPSVLGLDILDIEKNKTLMADYTAYLTATDDETREKYSHAPVQIKALMEKMNDRSESDEFENLVVSAANDLRNEIPAIISAVRSKNPDAKIIFQTIYNPYNNLKIEITGIPETVDLDSFGERSVSGMNNVIKELSESKGYTVADVWTAFDSLALRPVNADWDLMKHTVEYDPHPNEFGHSVIADVYYEMIKK